MSKAREFLEAHKDIFPGGESDDYCPKCGDQMYVDDKDKNLLRCGKCGASRKVSEALNTEQNTPKMRKRIEAAARKKFPRKKGQDVFFEHGQWWVQFLDGSQYSVVDAEGGPAIDGFDFEIVTEPEED